MNAILGYESMRQPWKLQNREPRNESNAGSHTSDLSHRQSCRIARGERAEDERQRYRRSLPLAEVRIAEWPLPGWKLLALRDGNTIVRC